jgi:hypothetical protein
MIQPLGQAVSAIDRLEQAVLPYRNELISHPVYEEIASLNDLRWFMENHVWAVWDFMSLLKTLQSSLTSVSPPWQPIGPASLRRFINEIVLGEESDVDADGEFASHFEMYLDAMREVGAQTTAIETFLQMLQEGRTLAEGLSIAPGPAREFVSQTFRVIDSGSLPAIVATFTFGREDLIPGMFQSALDQIGSGKDTFAPKFRFYLARHIEVDGDSHSGLARQMVARICRTSHDWSVAERSAIDSLSSRRRLWDGVRQGLHQPH